MSDLDVVVGARVSRVPGDKGDQVVYGEGGVVVVYAGSVIDGAVVNVHRPCLLVVDGVRLRLLSVEREGAWHVYRCGPWEPGPFEREGAVVDYDPDRVHEARKARLSLLVRVALTVAALPLFPFVGLLPQHLKERMRDAGIYPESAQMGSLVVEWALLLAVTSAEMIAIIAGSVVAAVVLGAIAVALCIDIPHRYIAAADQRPVGLMSWPAELWRALRDDPTRRLE